jgi:hypothetical protein
MKLLFLRALLAGLVGLVAQPVLESRGLAAENAAIETADPCVAHNAVPQQDVIVLGKIPDAPYVVVIPRANDVLLAQVRQCVPDAFQADSRWGQYIRAGAFSRYSETRSLVRYLYRSGFDVRTIYLP